MTTSSARGNPDLQTGRLTNTTDLTTAECRRLTNLYANQIGPLFITQDEKKQLTQFEYDRLNQLGEGFRNPTMWARLKRLLGL